MARFTSLRWKILTGYGTVLCLVGVVSVWAFVTLRDLGRATDAILQENYKSILAAERMVEAIERQDSATLLVLLGYEPEGARQFSENEGPFLESLARAKDNVTVPGEGAIVSDIDQSYSQYLLRVGELRLAYRSDASRSRSYYHEAVLPAFKRVRDGCGRLRDLNETAMVRASERARAISATARWSGALTTVVAVGLGLVFSLFLSNRLTRPLRQLTGAAKKVAAGDYDVQIETLSADELGVLASEFTGMAQKLQSFRELDVDRLMTEKRKNESIVASIDDGLVVVDADLKVTLCNPEAAEIFETASEQAVDRHFLELVRDENLFRLVREATETGQAPAVEEGHNLLSVARGPAQKHYQFSIRPMVPRGGRLLGVVLVLRDVTHLKEVERLKSEFVMTASHELRTPLTTIGMAIDLFAEDPEGALRDPGVLQAAQEETHRLKALVNDLLDLSKMEAGKIEMSLQAESLLGICERAVGSLTPQAREREIALELRVAEDIPPVRADAGKIAFVLVNLIANALRHVDPGGHIRIAAERLGERIHVSVTDDGTGIPYEHQAKIFDKFVKLKTERDVGGSGLGLSICREIVRAHGGTIWVDSVPGEGSTFTFTLPLAG